MWLIVWMLPFVAAAGIVLAVVVAVRSETWPRTAAFAYAALLSASAIGLTFYVASEDDYRRGGISRSGCCGRAGRCRDAPPGPPGDYWLSRFKCRVRPLLRRLSGELAELTWALLADGRLLGLEGGTGLRPD